MLAICWKPLGKNRLDIYYQNVPNENSTLKTTWNNVDKIMFETFHKRGLKTKVVNSSGSTKDVERIFLNPISDEVAHETRRDDVVAVRSMSYMRPHDSPAMIHSYSQAEPTTVVAVAVIL